MSSKAIKILNDAFQEGRPVILVAGQGFDIQGTATDPVLSSLSRRLSIDEALASWSAALKKGLSAADTDWLAERFSRSVPAEGALAAYELPWAAVFTSSIDPNFRRRFETRGRQPEAILASGTFARVARSRSRPPVHHILGRAGETASDAAPPTDMASLKRRMARQGVELLNRVAETATARGVVVIAGFDMAGDWLNVDDLLAPLSDRPGSKVVWFGEVDFVQSAFAADMVNSNFLLVEPGSLANAIAGPGSGWTQFSASATPDEPSMVTLVSDILDITPAVRLRVEASAAVVDDGWTSDTDTIEPHSVRSAFQRFHGDLSGFRGRVEGIAHGFAFRRDFEQGLTQIIDAALRHLGKSDGVVIVHGQSGTGKSVALARLARELRQRLRLPVLVATTRVPAHADLDAFCAEAERAGAAATVLLCDTNESVQRYIELASALRSRGRRLLIVGTSYRVERHLQAAAGQRVEAPAIMSNREMSDLRALLKRFAPELPAPSPRDAEDGHVLAMFYRSIAEGREHIRARVNAEARSAEKGIREAALSAPTPPARSQLAESLIMAGIASQTSSLFVQDESAAALGLDAAGRLIDYVMVPGRLNCPVPLNLIMRMLTRHSSALELEQILHVFADLDIFRWHSSDNEGAELLISPRLQLEAELICRSRLGDVGTEVQKLVELIGGVEASGVDRESERSFLLDLLQKLDRQGPRKDVYRSGYLDFAQALTRLRTERGVVEGPLMVRECTFRRQAIWAQLGLYQTNFMDEDRRLEILDEARSIVEEAFRLIGSGALQASKRTRQNLASERASIYGYLAVQRSRLGDAEGAWANYLAAKAASNRAIALTDNYHPVDIALWTSSDILEDLDMLSERRAEVIADIYAGLDLVDVEALGSDQRARYYERKAKAGNSIGNAQLSTEAIAGLEVVAPAAASFLIARRMAESLETGNQPYTAAERAVSRKAADYLSGRKDRETADDPRCARLLLRLRWAEATGQRILSGERGDTPGEPRQLADLLTILTGINERAGTDQRNSERYLEAVLGWLSRDFHRSADIWRALSRDSDGEDRMRVVRRLVASGTDGLPLRFRGRVEGVRGGTEWKVRVEGLNTTVNLLFHEFNDQDLTHGRELLDFGVAFNYVGPIADPLRRLGMRR